MFQPGRPRQHLQRHGAGHGGRQRGDRRDAPDRRAGPGGRSAASTSAAELQAIARRRRACAVAACCSPPSSPTVATPRPSTPTCSSAAWSPTRSPRTVAALRPAAHRHRGRDRRGGRHHRRRAGNEALCSTSPTSPPTSWCRCCTSPSAPTCARCCAGSGVALIFEKPSNRTRQSMEMAVVQLGGHPVYTRGEEVGFDVRESVEDVTRMMAGYHAVLAARVFDHARRRADGRGQHACRSSTCSATTPTRCRRSPTC